MKRQVIARQKPEKTVTLIDNRTPPPEPVNVAVRTILYVEVGGMDSNQVANLVSQVSQMYTGNKGGIHYVLPVRNGKIGADIFFESEWLKVVREICTVQDGQIQLKDGAKDIKVTRELIND